MAQLQLLISDEYTQCSSIQRYKNVIVRYCTHGEKPHLS